MESYLKKKFPQGNIADSTYKKRVQCLLKLVNDLDSKATDFSILNDIETVNNYMKTGKSIGSYWNLLWHVKAFLDMNSDLFSKKTIESYHKIIEQVRGIRDKTNSENYTKESKVPIFDKNLKYYQDLLDKLIQNLFERYNIPIQPIYNFDEIDNHFIADLQDYVLLACYLFQPSLRNNWGALHMISKLGPKLDSQKNYILIDKDLLPSKLILHQFKNSKQYSAEATINITDKLAKLLQIWISILKGFNKGLKPEYLLVYTLSKGSKINKFEHVENTDALAHRLGRVSLRLLDKKITINDYRILWEKAIQSDPSYNNLTLAEKEKIHQQLLHKTHTALGYNKVLNSSSD